MRITLLLFLFSLKLFTVKGFAASDADDGSTLFLSKFDNCVDLADNCVDSFDNCVDLADKCATCFFAKDIHLVSDTIPLPDSVIFYGGFSKLSLLEKKDMPPFHTFLTDSSLLKKMLPRKTGLLKTPIVADPLGSLKAAYAGLYEDQRRRFGQIVYPESYYKEVERLKGIVNKDYLLNGIRELNTQTFRRPFQLQELEVEATGQYAPLFPDTMRSYFMNTFSVNSVMQLGGIPFAVTYQHQYQQIPAFDAINRSLFSAKFDKTAYVNKLKSYIPDFDPKSLLPSTENIWETVKRKGEQVLKEEIKTVETKFKGLVDTATVFQQVGNVFDKNIQSYIQEYLDPAYLQKINQSITVYTNYQQQLAAGQTIDTVLFKEVENIVLRHKASQEILAKITTHKRKWDESGIAEKLKSQQLLNTQQIQQIAKDPKSIVKEAEKYVNLSQLQKLFLKFNQLNLGQSGVDASPLTLQNYLGNGVHGELLTKRNTFLAFTGGRQKDLLSVFDRQFTNPLMNNENNHFGFRTGKGSVGKNYTHVSFHMFDQQQVINPMFQSSSPDRRTAVTTISSGFDLGSYGYIEAEVSRSSAGYQNIADPTDSVQQKFMPMQGLLNFDAIGESLAFSFNYRGEIEKFDLQHSIQVSSTPNGYSNPGSAFLQRGQKELAVDLKKWFLKRTLILTLKGKIKAFSFGTSDDQKWIHSSYFVDARYKLKRGQSISLRYQPNQFVQVTKGERQLYTKTERLAVDAVAGAKFFGKTYRNNASLAYTNNSFVLTPGSLTSLKSVLFSSVQTLSLGKRALSITSVYNHVSNKTDFVFFNSSLNCDMGMSYTFLKHFTASSSIGYASVKGWYRQLSYKQSLSGSIHERFDVSLYLDIRNNLKLYQPIYTGTTRAEFSLFYTIRQ